MPGPRRACGERGGSPAEVRALNAPARSVPSRPLPPGPDRAHASVAQLAEPLICNQEAVGSSPTAGSSASGSRQRRTREHSGCSLATRPISDETGARRVTDAAVASDARASLDPPWSDHLGPDPGRARSHRTSEPRAPLVPVERLDLGGVPRPRGSSSGGGKSGPGRIPERPKGSDCKSDGIAFTGSNPVPPTPSNPRWLASVSSAATPTRSRVRPARAHSALGPRGRSSMVERQPSKLNAWVRFPSPAPVRRGCERRIPAVRLRAPMLVGSRGGALL